MIVIYFEDDLQNAYLPLRTLRKVAPSFGVEVVTTIEAALARLAELDLPPFDLVLTDMHLSDGDGLSLLSYIRENAIPVAVVVITGLGDEDTAVAALKARADDYVVKRKDYLDQLVTILESALNHYLADAARRAQTLHVLYAQSNAEDILETRIHFAVHADHLQLDIVPTPHEALAALKANQKRYDVVLLDFEPPELKALDALRELRATVSPDLPVVLICGSD